MNSELNETNKNNQSNSEKINLNHLFSLIANPNETKSYLSELNNYFREFSGINSAQYNRLNEFYFKFSLIKSSKNFVDTPIYQIELILKNLIEMQLKISKLISSKCESFNLISNKIDNFGKLISDISLKFKKSSFHEDISLPEINAINKDMNDLEKKIIDEYVFEKYNKHIIGIIDEKVDDLLSKIKEKENNLFKSVKEKKNKDYLLLKESNDKIKSVYNNINDIFIIYYLFLKEINQIFSIDLNNLKYQINTHPTKDENNNNNNENIVCSKSDYELQEKDLIRMQYHIKLIRNNKIYFQNYQNDKLKDNNLQKNENYGKDYLLLNDKEIYEIISKFYSYDLKILDKSKYNLEEQKGKLIAMELSNHILTYSENNESTISKLKEKYNEILQSINSKIINNLINIEKFFVALNEKFFDLVIYIYNEANNLLIKNMDFKLEDLMIILSQTYYKVNNGQKVYILEWIKSHDLYKDVEFWKNLIIKKINDEFTSIKNYNPKYVFNQEKKDEVIMPKIISFSDLMKEFDISKDKINETFNHVFDKYKCSEATRKEILFTIN